ncbi:MAG: RnfABCDGE type electron transport complex subunit B [Oscillospiraceae bacterium]|nr:RnfABCDGE type electron transport complex subunit B [Oscillospiraceae bacterium]
MNNLAWSVFWFMVFGLGLGGILAYLGKIFAAEADEKIELICDVLPSANCGGCGYASCEALSKAIVEKRAKTNGCPVCTDEMCAEIAEIMGEQPLSSVRYRAQVMCSGTNSLAGEKYKYDGIHDCIGANRLAGGSKACPNGCLGLSTCAKNCKFDAIQIINGVAAVDYDKCTACGACVAACPKMIIKIIPFDSSHWVGCMSVEKGALTRKHCDIGCIACRQCEKKCPEGAIKINDFCAAVDYGKCTDCGRCVEACSRRVIWSGDSQRREGIVRGTETKDTDIKDIKENL